MQTELKQTIKQIWNDWVRITPQNALYDRGLLLLFIMMMLVGFVSVTSASISNIAIQDPLFFAPKIGTFIILSCVVAYVFLQIPIQKWEKHNVLLFFIAMLALLAVLFIGREVKGAKRWISFVFFNFQPAELAKLALTCYLASFFTRKYDEIRSKALSFLRPTIVLSLMGFLLLLQPDYGSTVVLFIITFGMLFIVGAKIGQFVLLGGGAGFLFVSLILASEYRLRRILSFRTPFDDPYGDGFQLSNSLMALGRGEFTGEGLGNSIQKFYLPEAHNDFVMAIVGEEFGFLGIVLVIVLLLSLVLKALKIYRESLLLEERFKGFLAFGVAIWIFFQGFVNLGMTIGLLPTKGLTFPLISYGGSSLIIMSIVVALLLRIDYENRLARTKVRLLDD